MNDHITHQELMEWANTQNMKWFEDVLKVSAGTIQAKWANGSYTHDSIEGTAQMNAKALGSYETIQSVLYLIDQVKNEEDLDISLELGSKISR
jgi:hypothetical protein